MGKLHSQGLRFCDQPVVRWAVENTTIHMTFSSEEIK